MQRKKNNMTGRILEGIKVLDFSRYIVGPYCAKLLADMGADVIRIDDPGGSDDRFQPPFGPNREPLAAISINCNKRGITLNLRAEESKGIVQKLIAWADIVIENFSGPGKQMFGFNYPDLKAINEKIIYLSFSGYGSTGPYKDYVTFDSIIQAETGITYATGYPAEPPARAAISLVDLSTGINGALAAVLALYHRQLTGLGQMAEVSLMDNAISMVTAYGYTPEYEITGQIRDRLGLGAYGCWSNGFKSKDWQWIYISTLSQGIWKRFTRVLGMKELLSDERFADDYNRFINRQAIDSYVESWVSERDADDILQQLHEARVPCGKINTSASIASHPQVQARDTIVYKDYPGLPRFPYPGVSIKFSETPGEMSRRAPEAGEHNEEVYQEILNYSPSDIQRLVGSGII